MEASGAGKASRGPRVIKLGEAAQIISCSYSTALRMARSGELKAFRVRARASEASDKVPLGCGAWRTTDAIRAEYIEQRIAEQQLMSQSVEVD